MQTSVEKIREYALKNGFYISPYFKLEDRVKKMMDEGHCSCDKDRPECPCFQCEFEVDKIGRCKCSLILSKAYYDELMRRKEVHARTGKWDREPILAKRGVEEDEHEVS